MARSRLVLVVAVSAVLLLLAVLVVSAAQSSFSGQKWEYLHLNTGAGNSEEGHSTFSVIADSAEETSRLQTALNEVMTNAVSCTKIGEQELCLPSSFFIVQSLNLLGSEGWEMVTSYTQFDGGESYSVYVFKRPVE